MYMSMITTVAVEPLAVRKTAVSVSMLESSYMSVASEFRNIMESWGQCSPVRLEHRFKPNWATSSKRPSASIEPEVAGSVLIRT